jgi:hypothetical protein
VIECIICRGSAEPSSWSGATRVTCRSCSDLLHGVRPIEDRDHELLRDAVTRGARFEWGVDDFIASFNVNKLIENGGRRMDWDEDEALCTCGRQISRGQSFCPSCERKQSRLGATLVGMANDHEKLMHGTFKRGPVHGYSLGPIEFKTQIEVDEALGHGSTLSRASKEALARAGDTILKATLDTAREAEAGVLDALIAEAGPAAFDPRMADEPFGITEYADGARLFGGRFLSRADLESALLRRPLEMFRSAVALELPEEKLRALADRIYSLFDSSKGIGDDIAKAIAEMEL